MKRPACGPGMGASGFLLEKCKDNGERKKHSHRDVEYPEPKSTAKKMLSGGAQRQPEETAR